MKDGKALLEEAAQVWAKAQVVHEAPSWEGRATALSKHLKIKAFPSSRGRIWGRILGL